VGHGGGAIPPPLSSCAGTIVDVFVAPAGWSVDVSVVSSILIFSLLVAVVLLPTLSAIP
jgi:hypothetical protein